MPIICTVIDGKSIIMLMRYSLYVEKKTVKVQSCARESERNKTKP